MPELIQVFKPSLGKEEWDALRGPIESGWIGLGPRVREFERQFAEYVGTDFAVATSSATAALHLACLAAGIGAGDEVLVPTMTFASTAHAPTYCGARAVFVDIEEDTLNIDLRDMEQKITDRTRAIIPVHYGGHACRMDEILELAEQEGLYVIEDAAHACGSTYKGQRIGSLDSNFTCFSFHAVKNMTTGDGGMVTFNHKTRTIEKQLHRLRWCGIDKTTWDRTLAVGEGSIKQYAWYYEIPHLGYKYHMNDIAAAIGLVQLGKLEGMNARRREIVASYNAAFEGLHWLDTPVEHDYTRSSCHNYVIKTAHRDRLNMYLHERDIHTGVHYMPCHLQPYYLDMGADCPVAEEVWEMLLTLPLYPDMGDEDVARVIDTVLAYGREEV